MGTGKHPQRITGESTLKVTYKYIYNNKLPTTTTATAIDLLLHTSRVSLLVCLCGILLNTRRLISF
jgi:hypothetical protein